MSTSGQFHSTGPGDWVEQFRKVLRQEPPPIDDAILDAAYDAGEIDTATMFDYFEGRLSEEERMDLEAEVAASPHALRKLARIGAIVAESQDTVPATSIRQNSTQPHNSTSLETEIGPDRLTSTFRSPTTKRTTHQVKLDRPKPSLGMSSQPRREDCTKVSEDSEFEFYRSIEKEKDQLRIYHQSAPVGTLLGIEFIEPNSDSTDSTLTQFVVLRHGSELTTTSMLTIPASFQQSEVEINIIEIPLSGLTVDDAKVLSQSYQQASQDDPIAVTPLHEPRSAWQIWAYQVLNGPADQVHPAVWNIAEQIATG